MMKAAFADKAQLRGCFRAVSSSCAHTFYCNMTHVRSGYSGARMPLNRILTCMAPTQETNFTATIGDRRLRQGTHPKPITEVSSQGVMCVC